MRSVSRQHCHSACLLLGKPGKAACDWQLGTHHSYAYAWSYPLPYSSAAAALFFLFRRRFFFAGAAGGASSLIPVWKSNQ